MNKNHDARNQLKKVEKEIWITIHDKNGKMEGFRSVSTSVWLNRYCRLRAEDPKSVCHKCYAKAQLNRKASLDRHCEDNTEILTSHVLPDDAFPILNDRYFRLESFGDLNNDIQFINYIKFARRNPETTFALWTKNFGIVDRVLKYMDKPENLIIVASSLELNKPIDVSRWDWVDKVFTVYDEDYVQEHKVHINCGKKKCIECKLCYTHNPIREINEILKSNSRVVAKHNR